MNSLFAELHNIALFFETILLVSVYTGLAVVALIAVGYEITMKRRA